MITRQVNLSVSEFVKMKSDDLFENIKCENCNELTKFTRIFKPTSSRIVKGRQEMLSDIQDEVKKTVSKVRAGNAKAIRDIYGEEI